MNPNNNQSKTGQNSFSENDSLRVSVLSEALPYIQKFVGKVIVIKYGGAAMGHYDLQEAVFRDIALLSSVGVQPVIIHGGGPEINQWLKKLGIKAQFLDGLRITDSETMDIVEMVLVGRVNKQIVNGLNKLGAQAVGLSGIDGGLAEAKPWGDGRHGFVGDIERINPELLNPILSQGYVPVISSVAATRDGISLNINADTIAAEIAASLQAEKLILLTDTPGILKDKNNSDSIIRKLNISQTKKLIDERIVEGGMRPKAQCCIRALKKGVCAAHIIDGRVPHAILLEVFTDTGIGTMVSENDNC